MTQFTWDEVAEGQEIALVEEMSTQRLVIWAAAVADYYQIHYDESIAIANDLPGIIVHGALKGMLVGRLLDEFVGEQGRIVRWGVAYRGMDRARVPITVWGKVTRKYEDGGRALLDLNVGVRQQDDTTETTPGTATVELPRK